MDILNILNTLLYFSITIGVLVFVHEMGHFLAAKWSGMRVETFSIGFPPRAFGYRFGTKKLQKKFLSDIQNSILNNSTFLKIHIEFVQKEITKTKKETFDILSKSFSIEDTKTSNGEIENTLVLNDENFPQVDEKFKENIFSIFSNDEVFVEDYSEYLDIKDDEKFRKYYATDYCFSWLPFGGYVKISGIVDESFDTNFINKQIKPWEFRAKSNFKKMLVISAGVIMNLIFAIIIFGYIKYSEGKTIINTTKISVVPESAAFSNGFFTNDSIVEINNKKVLNYNDIIDEFTNSQNQEVTIKLIRDNREKNIQFNLSPNNFLGISPNGILPKINFVEDNSSAHKIGLKKDDIIIAIDSNEIDINSLSYNIKKNTGKEVLIKWKRNSSLMEAKATVSNEGRIGVKLEGISIYPTQKINYSILEAFPEGIKEGIKITILSYVNIWQMIIGNVSAKESLGGPIKIAQISAKSAEQGITTFLSFIAILSISLAILNILPLPALDGGHFIFLVIEAILRREISTKVKIKFQQVGVYLLLALMVFILYNDISNL